jgi:hypothetical protein
MNLCSKLEYIRAVGHFFVFSLLFWQQFLRINKISMHWTQYDGASTCHIVHHLWKPLRWQREIKFKLTCSWCHSVPVDSEAFFLTTERLTPKCVGLCNSENETVEHILLGCSSLSDTPKDLQIAYKRPKD